MIEAENQDVNQEFVAPTVEDESPVQRGNEGHASESESGHQSDKERNFAALRESMAREQALRERTEQENQYYREQLERMSQMRTPEPVHQEPTDPYADLGDEDWTPKSYVNSTSRRTAEEVFEAKFREWEARREEERVREVQERLPKILESERPDYKAVLSEQNIKNLRTQRPHLAESIAGIKDPYQQAIAAYDAVKAFCPSQDQRAAKETVQQNAQRPGTISNASSGSPLSGVREIERGMSQAEKDQHWREMQSAMRGR